MTFESSLKRLAEKEPEKFAFLHYVFHGEAPDADSFTWGINTDRSYESLTEELTQDDIDEILALIGWEYEVFSTNRTDKWWRYEAWQLGGAVWIEQPKTMFPTKLEAAKAALIAVLEKEYP